MYSQRRQDQVNKNPASSRPNLVGACPQHCYQRLGPKTCCCARLSTTAYVDARTLDRHLFRLIRTDIGSEKTLIRIKRHLHSNCLKKWKPRSIHHPLRLGLCQTCSHLLNEPQIVRRSARCNHARSRQCQSLARQCRSCQSAHQHKQQSSVRHVVMAHLPHQIPPLGNDGRHIPISGSRKCRQLTIRGVRSQNRHSRDWNCIRHHKRNAHSDHEEQLLILLRAGILSSSWPLLNNRPRHLTVWASWLISHPVLKEGRSIARRLQATSQLHLRAKAVSKRTI